MLSLEIYKKIYLIRASEKAIIDDYSSDEMKTPMHMSMGGEAISVGVCQALLPKDQVFGTYRSHALYLAKGGDIDGFFAEMYGKVSGVVKGKGGSMHLSAPEKGMISSSAVVASTIPVAVGSAFVNKVKKNNKIVAVFFGDGAIDEGAFWESLNLACLMRLPIIFVCEDNGFAVHTQSSKRHGYKKITEIVSKFNCKVFSKNATDAEEIFHLTNKAKGIIQDLKMPVFLHLKYYRYLEHVGVFEDFDKGYRNKKEFEKWFKFDPLKISRKRLLRSGFSEKEVLRVEKNMDQKIGRAVKAAKKAHFPPVQELYKDVYYER